MCSRWCDDVLRCVPDRPVERVDPRIRKGALVTRKFTGYGVWDGCISHVDLDDELCDVTWTDKNTGRFENMRETFAKISKDMDKMEKAKLREKAKLMKKPAAPTVKRPPPPTEPPPTEPTKTRFKPRTEPCGKCKFCLDKLRNGGPNRLRRMCIRHEEEKRRRLG